MSPTPTIFVSSTIRDFTDLRSALKFHLEGFGFHVQMSEFADFDKPLDRNSYEACFEAIRKAQLFVLLIGGRRGGWYDQDGRISITQAEYRAAYEEARGGRLQLAIFVRRTIWDQLEVLPRGAIRDADTQARVGEQIDDYEHLRSFVDEVRRAREMRAAVGSGGVLPARNWVHTFSGFHDLVDVLRIALSLKTELSAQLLADTAADELAEYVGQFYSKRDGKIRSKLEMLPEVLKDVQLSTAAVVDGAHVQEPVSRRTGEVLGNLWVDCWHFKPLPLTALERVCFAPGWASYDRGRQRIQRSAFQEACARTLRAFRLIEQPGFHERLEKHGRAFLAETEDCRGRNRDPWLVSRGTLVYMIGLACQLWRAVVEAENVMAHVKGGLPLQSQPTAHIPRSPLKDQARREDDRPTAEEVLTWVTQRPPGGAEREPA